MKTTYTDEELQSAIDAAFPSQTTKAALFTSAKIWPEIFKNESRQRLAIAKAFLEKLEPDPYAALKKAHAEGKVIQALGNNGSWHDLEDFDFCTLAENYRIKPEPVTFEAHGKTWTRHTPGDPMPCDGETVIYAYGDNVSTKPRKCADWFWEESGDCLIIGWRYADEQPNPLVAGACAKCGSDVFHREGKAGEFDHECPKEMAEPQTPSWTPAVGDIVQLKSGGPKMTIFEIIPDEVWCTYFDGKIIQHEFPKACLTLVTE